MHVLYEQLMKFSEDVARYEEWFTTGLALDDDGNCIGAICQETSATARWSTSGRRR